MRSIEFSVSDFVAVFNQMLEYAYPSVTIIGELANFRVSKNRWVYFDLKDDEASLKFWGSVYNLPGPLEDGMMVRVSGSPRLHPQFGFSVTMQSMQPAGEGSIKKAAKLLEEKLTKEGLFDPSRKRELPFPPSRIGLITSGESAAYADFTKIIKARWNHLEINHYDVQVQGEDAPNQIIKAVEYFNSHSMPPDVLVIIRGGGSADDLQAFSTEQVTRAVAASRIPTMVAIGHEIDVSLAELAADQRASTPSNAAELLVPDKQTELLSAQELRAQGSRALRQLVSLQLEQLASKRESLQNHAQSRVAVAIQEINTQKFVFEARNPLAIMKRGYAIIRQNNKVVRSSKDIKTGKITIEMHDGTRSAEV